MARKRRAPNYTGALAQPIYVEDYYKFTGGLGQAIQEPDIAAIIKERAQRVQLLFRHYKIDLSDEQRDGRLAMRLALAHVPGLQVANRPKRGRKPTWKTGLGDELVRAVDDVKSRTGKSITKAIAELRKEPKWGKYSARMLEIRYWEARRRQRALASLRKAWLNEVNIAFGLKRPG